MWHPSASKALPEALLPILPGDRAQLIEAAKATKCAVVRPEQVPHDVLDGAGEQMLTWAERWKIARMRLVKAFGSPYGLRLLAIS